MMTEMEKIIWKKVRSTFSLKKNFQLFCLSLKKLLLTFCVISWAFSKASDIPTPLNTLTIISLSVFKWWYKSTIHLACMGLIIDKRRETFTSDEAIPFLKAIDFGALMTFRSSGWNLLVWSQSQNYFWHKILSNHCCAAPSTYPLSPAMFAFWVSHIFFDLI